MQSIVKCPVCTGNFYQVMYVVVGLVAISKTVSDDHFYFINNEKVPSLGDIGLWLPGLMYFALHAIVRLVSYAFLAAYYNYYVVLALAVQVPWNFVIERIRA